MRPERRRIRHRRRDTARLRRHLAQALRHALQLLELPGDLRELGAVAILLLHVKLLMLGMMRLLPGMEGFPLLMKRLRPPQPLNQRVQLWNRIHRSLLLRHNRTLPRRKVSICCLLVTRHCAEGRRLRGKIEQPRSVVCRQCAVGTGGCSLVRFALAEVDGPSGPTGRLAGQDARGPNSRPRILPRIRLIGFERERNRSTGRFRMPSSR